MKLTRRQLKKLIWESNKVDNERKEKNLDILDKEHQSKYKGMPLTKHARAYGTEPTVELDPEYLSSGQDVYDMGAPTYEEFEAVRLLVLQNNKNIANLKNGFDSLVDEIDSIENF